MSWNTVLGADYFIPKHCVHVQCLQEVVEHSLAIIFILFAFVCIFFAGVFLGFCFEGIMAANYGRLWIPRVKPLLYSFTVVLV